MIATKNPYIKEAYISKDKQKRLEYEAREKAIRDYNAFINESREEGRTHGREEGRKEGEEQGRKKGIEQKAIEIAKNSLKAGFTIDQIALITGLPINTILVLKDNK